MKVLALGGCGVTGRPMVKDLVESDDVSAVVIGDINIDALRQLEAELASHKVTVLPLDIYDYEHLLKAMREVDVVAEIARHPIELRKKYVGTIVKAAIDAKKDLVDAQAFPWKMELNEQAKAAGVTIIHGMGIAPGTSNLLSKYGVEKLDEVDDVHITWVSTTFLAAGATMIRLHFREIAEGGERYKDGKCVDYPAFSDWGEVEFAEPIGKVEVCSCPAHPEQMTIPKHMKVKNVDVRMGLYPRGIRYKLESFVRWGLLSQEPLDFQGVKISPLDYLTEFFRTHPTEVPDIKVLGLTVEIKGKRGGKAASLNYSYISPEGQSPKGTGITCSVGAIMLGRKDIKVKGVLPPEAAVNPAIFFTEMKKRDFLFTEKEEVTQTI